LGNEERGEGEREREGGIVRVEGREGKEEEQPLEGRNRKQREAGKGGGSKATTTYI